MAARRLRTERRASVRRNEGRADGAHLGLAFAVLLLRWRRCLGRLSWRGVLWLRPLALGCRCALAARVRRLRQHLGLLLGHDNVALLDGVVFQVLERLRPGLAWCAAAARRIERLAERECVGQFGIAAPAGRGRLRDILSRITVAIERHFRRRTHTLADLLVLREARRCRRIRDRE